MGEKTEKKFLPETNVYREQKRWKKFVWKNCENTFFYKHMNIVPKKWGEKTREIIFSKNTRISQAKNDGKKSSGKSAKTRFFYKYTIS